MANELRPPPYPPRAGDVETLPGLDQGERIGRLVQEVVRLRSERDEALAALPSYPPPTRKQTVVRGTVGAVKWLGVVTLLLTAAAEAAALVKPEYVGPLQSLKQLVEGLL